MGARLKGRVYNGYNMEVFEAKVRKVGNSLGVLIPKEMAGSIREGQKVKVGIYPTDKERLKAIRESFGIARDVKVPFVRDKDDRF